MKSFYSLLLLTSIFFISQSCVKAQEPDFAFDHPSTPLFLDFTSTGCPSCGQWGIPNAKLLLEEHGNNVNHLAIHVRYNDPLESDLTTAISQNRPGRKFTPQFWVNNQQATHLNVQGYFDNAITFNKFANAVSSGYNKADIPALDGIVSKKGNKMKVDYAIRFNEESNKSEEYYLACYLVQDGYRYAQKGTNMGEINHDAVLTASANDSFGTPITSTAVGITHFSDVLDASGVKGNAYAMLVLWKKNGVTYEAVNSLMLND